MPRDRAPGVGISFLFSTSISPPLVIRKMSPGLHTLLEDFWAALSPGSVVSTVCSAPMSFETIGLLSCGSNWITSDWFGVGILVKFGVDILVKFRRTGLPCGVY